MSRRNDYVKSLKIYDSMESIRRTPAELDTGNSNLSLRYNSKRIASVYYGQIYTFFRPSLIKISIQLLLLLFKRFIVL